MNRGTDGQLDGTATVSFSVNVRNYGAVWLYGVQATDLMEGSGATQFGSFTRRPCRPRTSTPSCPARWSSQATRATA
jgi:hypothetical protein